MTATNDAHEKEPENILLAAARDYTRRGWRVVPVIPGQKGVALSRWQALRLEEDELPKWFGPIGGNGRLHHNIGVLLGEPSGGLVDVDCDAPEAREAAAELLPATGLVSGRAGNPASHYWYRIEGEGPLPATAKFVEVGADPSPGPSPLRGRGESETSATLAALPLSQRTLGEGGRAEQGREGAAHRASTMLVELRSTGQQTVVPPSVHPSGETLRWERGSITEGEPGVVTARELRAAVVRVAAVALLARRWPGEGQRDEAAKDLAGLLLRGKWDEEAVDDFVRLVARIAGDEEWRRRGKARGTARKLAEGDNVTGGPSLAGRLVGDGERVVAQVRAWLGLRGLGSAQIAAPSVLEQAPLVLEHTLRMLKNGEDAQERVWQRWSVAATDVERTTVHWLWQGRIPLGGITILDGDPGLGKSLLTLDLAARVTRGRMMPDGSPGVAGGGGVVLLSAEDGLSATILPRLDAAAADMERVEILRGSKMYDEEAGREVQRLFVLPQDIPWLEDAIQEKAAKLAVIDPLMSFLDPKFNSWRDQDVRSALAPLAALAERTGVAVVILRHLNKASGMSAIQRGGGSIGIIAAARSGLLVAKHPDDPDHERVLASVKSNLGPPMPSLSYRIRLLPIGPETLKDEGMEYLVDVPVVQWLGECDLNAAQLLAAPQVEKEKANPSKVAEAERWLLGALADGPQPWETLDRDALAAGIASGTLVRARRTAKLVKQRIGFNNGGYVVWNLPKKADDATASTYLSKTLVLEQSESMHKNDADAQEREEEESNGQGARP